MNPRLQIIVEVSALLMFVAAVFVGTAFWVATRRQIRRIREMRDEKIKFQPGRRGGPER